MLTPGMLARSSHRSDSPVGLVLFRTDAKKLTLWLATGRVATYLDDGVVAASPDDLDSDCFLRDLLVQEGDALSRVPSAHHASIRKNWYGVSLFGEDRYTESSGKDRTGIDGQKANAELLRGQGIGTSDPRFEQVRRFGETLYRLKPGTSRVPKVPSPRPSSPLPAVAPDSTLAHDGNGDEMFSYKNDITTDYKRRCEAIRPGFAAASDFLSALEHLGGDFHLGTNTNAHLYHGRRYLVYVRIEPREQPTGADPRLLLRPRPNGSIKSGTHRAEHLLFPSPLVTVARELGGYLRWALDGEDGGLILTRATPPDYFTRVLDALRTGFV